MDCADCDVETGVVDNEVLEVEFTALWLDGRICRGSTACCWDDPDPCVCRVVCCGAGPRG